MLKGFISKIEEDQKLWTVKWQETYNYQQLNLKKQKQTKQTTRTGTEPEKWRSHGGLSGGKGDTRQRGSKGEKLGQV